MVRSILLSEAGLTSGAHEHSKGFIVPRYYFDVSHDDQPWSSDHVGDKLPGPDETGAEALEIISEAAQDFLRSQSQVAVRVRDGQTSPLMVLTLTLGSEIREI